MTFSTRLVFVAVALLTAPIASRGQGECDLPTQEDVENVGGAYLSSDLPEGSEGITMTVFTMHFTCLATVALDKYTFASVVVNATDSANTPVTTVRQFQLQCSTSNDWDPHGSSKFESNIPSDPFNLETEIRCSGCVGLPSNAANYNADTNCLYCNTACGSNFCTGDAPGECCQGFDSNTGDCVDCTTIGPNYGPNDDFVCVCQITCEPGYAANNSVCTCELADGCEAFEQPCQNGSCTSDLTASPPYSCLCDAGFTGQNCSAVIPTVELPPTSATTAEIPDCGNGCVEGQCNSESCCEQCIYDPDDAKYTLDTDNCTCVEVPTTQPTRDTEPTCPSTCRDCDSDDPTCCTACPEGFTPRSCECVEEEDDGRSLGASQVAGIAVGLLLFILLILALAVLLAYVIYYFYDNKQKLKKGTALSPFSNGESHSNPLYLTPEEVEVED